MKHGQPRPMATTGVLLPNEGLRAHRGTAGGSARGPVGGLRGKRELGLGLAAASTSRFSL